MAECGDIRSAAGSGGGGGATPPRVNGCDRRFERPKVCSFSPEPHRRMRGGHAQSPDELPVRPATVKSVAGYRSTRSSSGGDRLDLLGSARHRGLVLLRSVSNAFCSDHLDVLDAEKAEDRLEVDGEMIVCGERPLRINSA